MKFHLSRYGGHGLPPGRGKSSSVRLPEVQTLDNFLNDQPVVLTGIRYVSSYRILPDYMGSFGKLPRWFDKIATVKHVFNEINMPCSLEVATGIYMSPYKYSNVVACAIKTDFRPISDVVGKMESGCDLVLTVLFEDCQDVAKGKEAGLRLLKAMLILIFEMGVHESIQSLEHARGNLASRINTALMQRAIEEMKGISSTDGLDHLLTSLHRLR